jgi:hypothetical protein
VTFALRQPEPFRQATTFNANGFDPVHDGYDPSVSLNVVLLEPER